MLDDGKGNPNIITAVVSMNNSISANIDVILLTQINENLFYWPLTNIVPK